MRRAFFETLAELGRSDSRVLLLTADLGFRAVEVFAEACSRQFFNVGVSEQNMIGLATGLAEAGFLPFTYSITPFAVLRAFEFIRNGPIAHRLPVRVVGIGAGFDYGTNGISHYALEDIGLLRTQPRLTLIAPADSQQARSALEATWSDPRPLYFRLSKAEDEAVPGLNGKFALGQTQRLRDGRDVLILALGTSASDALEAARLLDEDGISGRVELFDNFEAKPSLDGFPVIVTLEAHYVNGGLGSLVCELAAERGLGCRILRCGVEGLPDGISGSTEFMKRRNGIDAASVAARIREALR